MTTVDLEAVRRVATRDDHLAVVATTRPDGSIHASVVSAGVMKHPVTAEEVVAFVTYGRVKLRHLRARPAAAVTFTAGAQWATVEGQAELAGPDDALEGFDPAGLPQLLRDVFTAAGGTHDDWGTYDRVMAEQRRVAVLVVPGRIYTN